MRRTCVVLAAMSLTAGGCATSRSEILEPPPAEGQDAAAAREARTAAADRANRSAGHPADHPAGHPAGFSRDGELRRATARYLARRPGRAALLVQDLKTGVEFGYQPWSRFVAASVMKVNILVGLLLRRQDAHRGLSQGERVLAVRMIKASDNEAADEMYRKVGRAAGLDMVNRRLGLVDTHPHPESWGSSRTSPQDQVRLLHALAAASSPLSEANRRLVLRLMESVLPSQAWGIGAGARRKEAVAVKNGWTPLRFQGTGWAVHSVGRVRGRGHDFLVAIFTTGSPAWESGIETTEGLARLTLSWLRTA